MTNKYIAIEGVIGVGKTTLARLLQPLFNASILLEVFEENPFLASFYQDRERYAFQTQLFFLLSRYHQQHQAIPRALAMGHLISDYTFAKDELFAWLNLKDDELAMYGRVHAALGEKIPKPDLIVYLRASHEVTMRRILLRDRAYERDMDPEYIRDLGKAYDAWLGQLNDTAVLTIDNSELDFLVRPEDLQVVIDAINEALARQKTALPSEMAADELVRNGGLSGYQQFHRQMERDDLLEADIFLNYLRLSDEVGKIARELGEIRREERLLVEEGRPAGSAHEEAIMGHRATLRDELASLFAYLLRLANDTGIDLEQAYIERIGQSIGLDQGVKERDD